MPTPNAEGHSTGVYRIDAPPAPNRDVEAAVELPASAARTAYPIP